MNLFLVTARVLLGTVLLTGLCFLTSSFASQPTIRIGLEEDIESLPFVKETVASLEKSLADYPMVFVPVSYTHLKKFDFRKEKVFDAVILQDNSTGPIHPQRLSLIHIL